MRYPPSTRKSPSSHTGGNNPRTVMDARTYRRTEPATCVLSRPRDKFVLQQKNGSQRSSISTSPSAARSMRSTPLPLKMESTGSVRSVRRCRGELIARTSSFTRGSMCVVDACRAYSAAMSAPCDVPPTQSIGTPTSSSARNAPRCARPCPPPPVKMTPTDRPATCLASRSASSPHPSRRGWYRTASGRQSLHRRERSGASPGAWTRTSSAVAPRRRRHRRRRSDAFGAGSLADARATTRILSACDTHTCDHGDARASACRTMNRWFSSCCAIHPVSFDR